MPLEVKIEDLIRLELVGADEVHDGTKRELQRVAKRLQKEKWIKNYRESSGLFLMEARPNGDCLYLDKERRCTVYDKRPGVCRQFPAQMGLRLGFCPYLKR
jgi:Fe-S-cluster containining protein